MNNKNPWDERYSSKDFAYGKTPNLFLQSELLKLKAAKILFPAEGEGRNSVYAATQGWDVVAFDSSIEGRKKALKLANEMKVSIKYSLKSYDEFQSEESSFDALALIYAHNPMRQKVHKKMINYLKKGGIIILEGFSKSQLKYGNGGPANLELLFSIEELKEDFKSLSSIKIEEKIVHLSEGKYHYGLSSVIRMVGVK